NELDEYASGDEGLWEGLTEHWDIINRKAWDALNGAILSFLNEKLKELIQAEMDKEESEPLKCTAEGCEELQTDDEFCGDHKVKECDGVHKSCEDIVNCPDCIKKLDEMDPEKSQAKDANGI
ncbi:MAG: hypothetical protein GWP06_12475, partial [Actinobacteria bacterium]|nr:hypothetical protein [Actinomycetota bacterium]